MKHFLTLFFLGVICTFPLFGNTAKKVVIATTVGNGVDENLKEIFMHALTSGLTNSEQFEVLTNRQEYAQKIVEEIAAQEGGIIDDNQWIDFGRASGAELMIYPTINVFDNMYFITVRLVDLVSGVSKKSIDPIMAPRHEIVDAAMKLARIISNGGISEEKSIVKDTDVRCEAFHHGGYIEKDDNKRATWERAMQHCEQKGTGWRLPTREELIKIFKAPGQFGQRFSNTTYWTSDKRNNFSIYTIVYPSCSITYESYSSECLFRCIYIKEDL